MNSEDIMHKCTECGREVLGFTSCAVDRFSDRDEMGREYLAIDSRELTWAPCLDCFDKWQNHLQEITGLPELPLKCPCPQCFETWLIYIVLEWDHIKSKRK